MSDRVCKFNKVLYGVSFSPEAHQTFVTIQGRQRWMDLVEKAGDQVIMSVTCQCEWCFKQITVREEYLEAKEILAHASLHGYSIALYPDPVTGEMVRSELSKFQKLLKFLRKEK